MNENITCIEDLNLEIKKAADKTIKATYKRMLSKDEEVAEPPWINDSIKEGIRIRKTLNRLQRNATSERDRENYYRDYQIQKGKVQVEIKEAIYKHEEKITNEIRNGNNQSKKMWTNINKLRKKDTAERQDIILYNEEGEVLTDDAAKQELETYWNGIYKAHENNVPHTWNQNARDQYMTQDNQERINQQEQTIEITNNQDNDVQEIRIHTDLLEHISMAVRVEKTTSPMKSPQVTRVEVKTALTKLKNNKATGPDRLKPELYKILTQKYQEERREETLMQQPYIEDEDRILGELLFEEKNLKKTKEVFYKFWRKREKKMKLNQ
ncbi:hypothetical protein Pmani_001395 [Petrolisthes manimaculis]|uniref:Uncharacterized protein n=1 Tax=Petrolisthes manimaculis TaxID=1843537 RepID=A0AAE1UKC5_9EUCA|nr:hypothetical protein Pmani_001395 [Petrolisthes manimaculis]